MHGRRADREDARRLAATEDAVFRLAAPQSRHTLKENHLGQELCRRGAIGFDLGSRARQLVVSSRWFPFVKVQQSLAHQNKSPEFVRLAGFLQLPIVRRQVAKSQIVKCVAH